MPFYQVSQPPAQKRKPRRRARMCHISHKPPQALVYTSVPTCALLAYPPGPSAPPTPHAPQEPARESLRESRDSAPGGSLTPPPNPSPPGAPPRPPRWGGPRRCALVGGSAGRAWKRATETTRGRRGGDAVRVEVVGVVGVAVHAGGGEGAGRVGVRPQTRVICVLYVAFHARFKYMF